MRKIYPFAVVYWAIVALGSSLLRWYLDFSLGSRLATSIFFFAMWGLMIFDLGVVSKRISFIRIFLPGMKLVDSVAFLPIYGTIAVLAYQSGADATVREFMVSLAIAVPVLFCAAVFVFIRLPHWRKDS